MIEACNITFMDSDWSSAAQSDACMRAYASFEHVVNFAIPCGSLIRDKQNRRSQYYRDAHGDMVRDAFVWLGSRSCDCAPGGLVIDVQELPAFIRNAKTLRFREQSAGCYRLAIVDDRECRHTLYARTSYGFSDGTLLAVLPKGSQFSSSAARAYPMQEAFRLYGKEQSPFMGGFARGLLSNAQMNEKLVANGMQFCELLASSHASSQEMSLVLSRLVGLGVGLTPSGDDFIVGALAIAQARSLSGGLGEELIDIVDDLGRTTTSVSQHYLMSAARGRFSKSVIDVVDAVLCGDSPMDSAAFETAIKALLDHGSTSGTDTLAGMVAMLLACSDRL